MFYMRESAQTDILLKVKFVICLNTSAKIGKHFQFDAVAK
jgi:hypothetical protein